MSDSKLGKAGWMDLTVDDADEVRDFYKAVVGWDHQDVDMGEYSDYAMVAKSGEGVAGVCHQRGVNKGQPKQWIVYFVVADLKQSVDTCVANGGEVVRPPKEYGPGQFCVIADPSGAVCALYQES